MPTSPEAYPPPEWTSRDGLDVPAPGAVLDVATRARQLGWDVRTQTSRGARPDARTGRPLKVATYWGLVLSFDSGRRAAYAVRDADTWKSIMLWGSDFPFFPLASVTDLRAYIETRGDVGPDWFDAIRGRIADAEKRDADKKACDGGKHPGGGVEILGDVAWCVTCGNSWKAGGNPWKRVGAGKDFAS